MAKLALFLCFAISATVIAAARDKQESAGGVSAKILGKSGKIAIRRRSQGEASAVVFEMDEIKERNSSGAAIGTSGKTKHSFNTFANQDFTFGPLVDKQYQNLATKSFNFSSFIASTGATLNLEAFIFLESGEVEFGDEATSVKNGTFKWNIEIKNWDFCNGTANACKKGQTEEFGSFLDFTICMKTKKKPASKTAKKPKKAAKKAMKRFDLGDGASMELASGCVVDGVNREMPTGYPMAVTRGSKNCYVFRFPKFNSSVLYDPTLEFGDDGDTNGAISVTSCSILSIVILTLVTYFFA